MATVSCGASAIASASYALWIVGPFVAWMYGISVWIMYSMFHECSWTSKLPSVALRTSWLVAAVACAIGVCQSRGETGETAAMVVPLTVVFVVGSAVLCRWTRLYDVVGVACATAKAPFYGRTHLQGSNVLITGANSGIGKETALQLASMGATVYFLCRSTSRAQQAVDDILRADPALERSRLKVVAMDLGDLDSIRKAVANDLKGVPVHVLINNAGLMMGTKTLSNDGMELMMQANHLGHFLLTRLLLDSKQLKVEASDDFVSRIINVTSSTYRLVDGNKGFDFDNMMCDDTVQPRRPYTLFGQYAQTKLANILFTKELAKRYPSLRVYAVHPGLVRTNVTTHMPWNLQTLNRIFAAYVAQLQKRPCQGAYSSVYCAAAPPILLASTMIHSGSYVVNCQDQPVTKAAQSPYDAQRLWTVSERLVGLATSTTTTTASKQ